MPLRGDAFWFKLAWKTNLFTTFTIWGPIWIFWWFIYFSRVAIFRSFFLACAKVGMLGPYGLYEIIWLLFFLAVFLDRVNTDTYPSRTAYWLNMLGVGGMLGFTSWVQFTYIHDINEWERLLHYRSRP